MKALFALLLLASCGKPQSSYADFLRQRNQLVCDAQARCGCPPANCPTGAATPQPSSFDASTATLCLDGLRGGLATCTSDAANLRGNLQICDAAVPSSDDGGTPPRRNPTDTIAQLVCSSAPLF